MLKTKQDEVADTIRERIISGSYPRGTQLKQADIATELGVSITPVREALHVLLAEGYVQSISHKGLIVPQITLDSVREIFDLRLLLEHDLTTRAVPHLTKRHIAELREHQRLLMEATASGDLQTGRTENYRFHFRLYDFAERPQTLNFVRVLWAKYPFMGREHDSRRAVQISEHEQFLKHLEDGDENAAIAVMTSHIQTGWNYFMQQMGINTAS